jgi:putative transcriptional regulator
VTNSLGARVRAERERARLSQDDLARAAGLQRSTVSALEGGSSNPRLGTLSRIAKVLGIQVVDLLLVGPEQIDFRFGLAAGVDLGPIATLEPRIVDAIAEALPELGRNRISVWPWCEPVGDRVVTTRASAIRVRAPASEIVVLSMLVHREIHLCRPLRLAPPTVQPVGPAESLCVLVKAPCPDLAEVQIRSETTAAGCCPPVAVVGRRPLGQGSAWLAKLAHVPAAASELLQRLRVPGPERLFVPA